MRGRLAQSFASGVVAARAFVGPAVALALSFVIPVAAYVGFYEITESRAMLVERVTILGNERVSDAAVLAAAQLDQPRNRLRCDAETMAEAIEALPWVKRASVSVGLRGDVVVDIVEARLRAIGAADELYLLDRDGDPIRPWRPEDRFDVPLFVGMARTGGLTSEDSSAFSRDAVVGAFGLLRAWNALGVNRRRAAREVHYDPNHGYDVLMDDDTVVRLGHDRWPARLSRLHEVLDYLASTGTRVAYIGLDGDELDEVPILPRASVGSHAATHAAR